MADFKKLYEEHARLQQHVSKAKALIAESEARLSIVNKEIEQANLDLAARAKDRQEWFNQK